MPQFATRVVKVLVARPLLAGMVAGSSRWRGRSRVLTVAAAGVLLAAGLFAQPAAAGTASITLKPSAGPPTATVTVTGAGFGDSETVAVDFSGTQVATAPTSSTGTFSAAFTVPASALPGKYPVTATGETSGLSATSNFTVRANWPSFRFGPAQTGLNPYENVISPANVSGLKTAWTATSTIGNVASSPAVAGGVAYIDAGTSLYAFSATGTTGCSGTPKTCQPLWSGTTTPVLYASPAVANGVIYLVAEGEFYAFSTTASSARCSGTPKTCQPLWTAAIEGAGSGTQSAVTVSGGVVYFDAGSSLYAFSAAGTTGCSGTPKTCQPLWTAPAVGTSSPAVSDGVVYAAAPMGLWAYSAAGTTGCSGTPKTCTPLWTGTTNSTNDLSSPAVAGGVVYLGSGTSLYAFSTAAGSAQCSGTPKVCTALWTGATSNAILSSPAVAGGVVYIGSLDGNLYAFNAAGRSADCSGTPKTCTPLWTAAGAGGQSSPAVANGVVYAAAGGQLYAFSAAGTTGCSGTPKMCAPLWTGTGNTGVTYGSPAVVNGMVYQGRWYPPYFSAYKL